MLSNTEEIFHLSLEQDDNSIINVNSYSSSEYQDEYNNIYNDNEVDIEINNDNEIINNKPITIKPPPLQSLPLEIQNIDCWKRCRNIDQYDFFPIKDPSSLILSTDSLESFNDGLKKELECFKTVRLLTVKFNIKKRKLGKFLTDEIVINAMDQLNTARLYVSRYYSSKNKIDLFMKNKQYFSVPEHYENLISSQTLLKSIMSELINETLPILQKYHEHSLTKVKELGGEIRSIQFICNESCSSNVLDVNNVYFESWLKSDERREKQRKLFLNCMNGQNCGMLINLFSNITFALGVTFASGGVLTPLVIASLLTTSFDVISKIILLTKKTYTFIDIKKQDLSEDEKQIKINQVTGLYKKLNTIISSICTCVNISLGIIDLQQAISGLKNVLKCVKVCIQRVFKKKDTDYKKVIDNTLQVKDLKDVVCELKDSVQELRTNYREM
jgi:hypothetical protein